MIKQISIIKMKGKIVEMDMIIMEQHAVNLLILFLLLVKYIIIIIKKLRMQIFMAKDVVVHR
jgi:hypothetical protein